MRKKAVMILLVLIAGGLCIGPLLNWLSTEPKYQGRTLSQWFKQYYMSSWDVCGDNAKREDAEEALRAIGTNAVPFLLEHYYSTNEDSAFQTHLVAVCARLPKWLEVGPFANVRIRREMAFYGLLTVRPPGDLIVPLVTNHLYSADRIESSGTLELLSHLRVGLNAAIPVLNQMLTYSNGAIQSDAIMHLARYGSDASPTVPTLAKLIENVDTDPTVIREIYGLLREWRRGASIAAPAVLTRFRGLPNSTSRVDIATTLCLIEPNQPEAIGFLVNLATNIADPLHTDAMKQFEILGTNARSAAPLVAPLIENEDSWALASTILLAVGDTDLGLKPFEDRLSQMEEFRRMETAMFILNHDPVRESAITNLVEIIQDKIWAGALRAQEYKWRGAMVGLVACGKEIAADPNHPLQEKAKRMLQLIEAARLEDFQPRSLAR